MSLAVFVFGGVLAASASYGVIFPAQGQSASAGTYTIVVAGLAIMLLVIYTGPRNEIRQSVTDVAISSTAFVAYVHRVLETSHTFSCSYLKEQITFEEVQKSGALMTEAMNQTIEAPGRKSIDSSQEVGDASSPSPRIRPWLHP